MIATGLSMDEFCAALLACCSGIAAAAWIFRRRRQLRDESEIRRALNRED